MSVVSSQLCWLFAFVYFRYSCDLTISPIYPQKESYGRLFICEMSARASAHQKEANEMVHRYAAYCGWVYYLYYSPKYIFETRNLSTFHSIQLKSVKSQRRWWKAPKPISRIIFMLGGLSIAAPPDIILSIYKVLSSCRFSFSLRFFKPFDGLIVHIRAANGILPVNTANEVPASRFCLKLTLARPNQHWLGSSPYHMFALRKNT